MGMTEPKTAHPMKPISSQTHSGLFSLISFQALTSLRGGRALGVAFSISASFMDVIDKLETLSFPIPCIQVAFVLMVVINVVLSGSRMPLGTNFLSANVRQSQTVYLLLCCVLWIFFVLWLVGQSFLDRLLCLQSYQTKVQTSFRHQILVISPLDNVSILNL